MKTIIERGASWTLEETKLLLSLWGQDLVQRQATCQKRTKEVYEKISEKFNHSGYERTPDQVRTRVFNMIAEYRRILRDPSPERMKKCIFFEALHRIYQAKHMDDVKSALDDYEPECPFSPASNTICSERGDESISDSEAMDDTLIINSGGNSTTGVETASTPNSIKNNNASATSDNVSDSISSNNDNINATQNNSNKQTESEKEASTNNQSVKKIKLESPKPGSSQGSSAETSTKQKTSSNSASSVNNNNSGSRHQSLLLPHATSASTSTPINKLTTSGSNSSTPAYINVSSSLKNMMGTTRLIGHPNGNETANINGTPTANRLPTTAAITSHQFYQAPVNTFDVTSSALLIDRMFAHLSRESENMREWIALEKDRIALERARRVQDLERDSRRERVLIDTLMKFQEQWISFISKLEPRLENYAAEMPTLNIPPRENLQATGEQQEGSQSAAQESPIAAKNITSTLNSSTNATPTTNSTDNSLSVVNTTTHMAGDATNSK